MWRGAFMPPPGVITRQPGAMPAQGFVPPRAEAIRLNRPSIVRISKRIRHMHSKVVPTV
jgi:hypothetical protein